ncbi:hypothetical protein Glove_249g16 [Diversispora epigaea]|uniref:Uncharacterized protein n=1 Tax=Diversispora epigaea TaxID=1348612 RepID=A0A397IA31_9GLOM|nr:hypothetical protein Glove_249g16 [Diversispora epigaea]
MSRKCRFVRKIKFGKELSLEVMMINSLKNENLLNNENNFESIHKNSNEDEDEDKNEGEDENENKENDSYNIEVEEESLTNKSH